VGAALLPALLALADGDVGLDGPELLTGLVGGYEVGIRAGMTLMPRPLSTMSPALGMHWPVRQRLHACCG